jgi:4-hydroxybutyrate dehydrogenase
MIAFDLKTKIHQFESYKNFSRTFAVGARDLIITSGHLLEKFIMPDCDKQDMPLIIDIRKYGHGEPSDTMVDALIKDINDFSFERVIGIGGGSVLDITKLICLARPFDLTDLFDKKTSPVREKQLILIPTTCGTGSEMTAISILSFKSRETKLGISDPALQPDFAILIPELVYSLPYVPFAASSIDALIHAIESYLSPRANVFTEPYAIRAINMICEGYINIIDRGCKSLNNKTEIFLQAAALAGISFGQAGVGAVHALSYPIAAKSKLSHGEANYVLLSSVLQKYNQKSKDGKIRKLKQILAESIKCDADFALEALDNLLEDILPVKTMLEIGFVDGDFPFLADNVLSNQQRLLTNSYIKLNRQDLIEIYNNAAQRAEKSFLIYDNKIQEEI